MRAQEEGFILVSTLLIMSILTILLLSLLQSIYLYYNMNNQIMSHHQALYQLERVAETIGKQLDHHKQCTKQAVNPTRISVDTLKQHGCELEVQSNVFDASSKLRETNHVTKFFYLISELDNDPDLAILIGQEAYSADQWILSLHSQRLPNHVLQLRVALPGKPVRGVLNNVHFINQGIMSWYYA